MSISKTQPAGEAAGHKSHHDGRETLETVLIVLVLVNVLRMFGCEAFVIPTGSMATTLLGAHKAALCPECGAHSLFNASDEAEFETRLQERNRALGQIRGGDEIERPVIVGGYCQNCRKKLGRDDLGRGDPWSQRLLRGIGQVLGPAGRLFPPPAIEPQGGDRVLVGKFLYEGFSQPHRWDVVVFKCPDFLKAKQNYIKRLIGLPGETIRIDRGDIYVQRPGEKDFSIASKPAKIMMAVRRLVYDNDLQPADLMRQGFPARWQPREDGKWTHDAAGTSFQSNHDGPAWLDYRHFLRDVTDAAGMPTPSLITDFESYNTGLGPKDNIDPANLAMQQNWVGDLMIDCSVGVPAMQGMVWFELVEGLRIYRCELNLKEQTIKLYQNDVELQSAPSPIGKPGQWNVRFANFDDRLAVWVEGEPVFGDGVAVKPASAVEVGPREQDLQPARIGVDGSMLAISKLKLFRDIYYSQTARHPDHLPHAFDPPRNVDDWRDAVDKSSIEAATYSIAGDEYFMLGDNSMRSSDGREWQRTHFVKRQLLLGRALSLYWPPWNWEFVR